MTKVTLRPSNIESLKGRVGQNELRESKTRQKYLDKLSRLITDVDVKTELGNSAYSRADDNRDFYIEIPKTKKEQSVTNLDEDVWDLLFQETVLFHEMGHILYTDFDAFEECMDDCKNSPLIYPKLFRYIFNSISDGCIETYLANDFNIEEDLILMNANLIGNQDNSNYDPYDAISIGLMDNGFYNSGRWEKIIDGDIPVPHHKKILKFEDRVEEVMEKAINEPSGKKRVDIALEFSKEVYDEFGSLNVNNSGNPNPEINDEFEKSSGGQKKTPEIPEETEPQKLDESGSVSGNSDEDEDEESGESAGIGDLEEKINEEYKEEVQRQSSKNQESEDDPVKDQLMGMASGDNLGKDIFVPDWNIHSNLSSQPAKMERKAQSLERILRSKLQRERSSKRKDGLREGRLNTTDLAMAATGSSYLFSREDAPEDKDYSVQIILDRSYSMKELGHGRIDSAQKATYQLSVALSNVGVDVSVLSFKRNNMYLEVPFGSDPTNYKGNIFSREVAGGTPLGEALEFSKEHVKNGKFDEHLVLVITDGEPSNKDNYLRVLREIESQVYGIYVNENKSKHGNHSEYFDCVRYGVPSEVNQICRELCEGMIG